MSGAHQIRKPRRLPRAEWLGLFTGLLALGLLAGLAVLVVAFSRDLRTQGADLRSERAYSRALAQQVEGLGGTPVAGPTGSPGQQGEKGDKGDPGEPGQPAPALTPSPGATGPTGPSGAPGADSTASGPPGPSGQPGADSTIPGPAGPTGPAGPAGQDGANGQDGTNGTDGKPPAGWTFTYLGVTYTCRPVDGFDESNPQYDCQPDRPGSGNGNSGDTDTQAAALDPRRTQYT